MNQLAPDSAGADYVTSCSERPEQTKLKILHDFQPPSISGVKLAFTVDASRPSFSKP